MATGTIRNLEASPEEGTEVEEVAKEPDIETLNIHQKLFGILSELGPVEKDKHVEIKGKLAYEYTSHDAVTAHIRSLFIKYRVLPHPTVADHKNDGNRVELFIDLTFINVDNPEDKLTVKTIGYGCDPSDKGPGKAFSYATKIAYLKQFMLNAGDDIELEDVPHDSAVMTASQKEDSERRVVEDIQAWAHTFKVALENCGDLKELDMLQKANADKMLAAPAVTNDYFVGLIGETRQRLKDAEAAPA